MLQLILFALVLALLDNARAEQECFANSYFPKLFGNNDQTDTTKTYSITASETLNAVFSGGFSSENGAWIMRVDLDTNRVRWRRYYNSPEASFDRVSAMSVNPAGDSLAVVVSGDSNSVVFTVRPDTGGYESQVIELDL